MQWISVTLNRWDCGSGYDLPYWLSIPYGLREVKPDSLFGFAYGIRFQASLLVGFLF